MQVTHSADHMLTGGAKTIEFGISNDAAFFHILSSTLYSDQRLAVAREVLCNVWDAHIRAGITDKPIEVTITDLWVPWDGTYGGTDKNNNGLETKDSASAATPKRARELTIVQREDPGIDIMKESEYALHVFMIDGHHRAVRRCRDWPASNESFHSRRASWRTLAHQRHNSDCTHRGKTFGEDRDLHHDHVLVNHKAPGFAGGYLLKSSLSSS